MQPWLKSARLAGSASTYMGGSIKNWNKSRLPSNTTSYCLRSSSRFFSENSGSSDDSNKGKKQRGLGWFSKDTDSKRKTSGDSKDSKVSSKLKNKRPGTSLIRRRQGQIKFDSDEEVSATVPEAVASENSEDSSEQDVETLTKAIDSIVKMQTPKPSEALILPTTGRALFPGFTQPFLINNRDVYEELKLLASGNSPYVGMFFRKDADSLEDSDAFSFSTNSLNSIGTFAQILKIDPVPSHSQPGSGVSPRSSRREIFSQDDPFKDYSEEELESASEWTVLLKAHRRIEMLELINEHEPLYGKIAHIAEKPVSHYDDDQIRAYMNEIFNALKKLMAHSPLLREHLQMFGTRFDGTNASFLADFAASLTSSSPTDLQEVLGQLNLEKRLNLVLVLLQKEIKRGELQQEISSQVESKVNETQRKYFLRQQMKQIQEELGIGNDDKTALIQKFQDKIDELDKISKEKSIKFPKEARKVIDEEMDKLQSLDKDSSEFNQTRRYLEWLTGMPWTKYTAENYDLWKAHKVLEEDHYGLEDIKERIMEYIAVGNLKGEINGKILLFVGPPGVGKTSIGKSIASALGREFYRFSVGGLSDVSEIKGHRRTYVGAMPGKIIQCLKQVETMNPLILIDEIDKLATGYRGDPASALLELLDPSQNQSFMDHYLDVPVDVSKVLFVCTANQLDSIPSPLLDRMEVLRLSGYDLPEKVNIAKNYLIPRAKKDSGLLTEESESVQGTSEASEEGKGTIANQKVDVDVNIADSAIESLARWYSREAGVRKLQQLIERMYRKVALVLVEKKNPGTSLVFSGSKPKSAKSLELPSSGEYSIQEEDLEGLVGKHLYQSDRMYEEEIPPGVVMGLAWTPNGGSSLYIETTNIKVFKPVQSSPDVDEKPNKTGPKSRGRLVVTGNLKDVMKESSTIAYTNAKHILSEMHPENDFFVANEIHLHVPEGATPKDGPSAGVTMTTALLSLALGKSVSPDLAMTGEISLTGMVLPVGGIKEKVIAARRSGVSKIIIPDANRKDIEELPEYLKNNLTVVFAKKFPDVYKAAFTE